MKKIQDLIDLKYFINDFPMINHKLQEITLNIFEIKKMH